MLCEVLYRIGDGGSWKDGEPVEVRAPGVFVTEAEFAAWLLGTEPASIATLRAQRASRMRSFAQRMVTLLDPAVDASTVGLTPEDLAVQVADAHAIRQKIADAGGVDSTWGFEELRRMSVMIADLDMRDIEEITSTVEEVPAGRVDPVLIRRRSSLVNYRALLSADSVAEIEDPTVLVRPARGETPFDLATLVTDA